MSYLAEPRRMSTFLGLVLGLVFLSVLTVNADDNACTFASYQDETVLVEAKKRLAPLIGHSYISYNEDRSYKYTVGICRKLLDDDSKQTAILQEGLNQDGTVKVNDQHSIGSLKDAHVTDGTDWIILEYKGGDTYGSHCGQEEKRSMLMISCDPNVDDSNAEMVFIKEENSKTSNCFYLFEMKHSAVCPEYAGSAGLSFGSILCIVFFSVFAVYLVVGFLYQRFVLGSKGVEQFPNYEFWKDFGNLQADGCDFVCRSRNRTRNPDDFRGIGDEQLEPAENVRDDNLLPM